MKRSFRSTAARLSSAQAVAPRLITAASSGPNPRGGYYEQTAQHAIHEASHVARNVLATLRGRTTRPYTRTLGMMASLGSRQGLALIGARLTLEGFPTHFLWRTFYLTQLPSLDRKARVAVDWLLALRYPEDIASSVESRLVGHRASAVGNVLASP